jgi:hypothetical protein
MHEPEMTKLRAATPNLPLTIAAMIVAGLLRFVPFSVRPPNFAAIGALSLYSGARLPWWAALLAPLGVMYVTDAIFWRTFLYKPNYLVYGCYAATAIVGLLLRHTQSQWKIGAAALGTGFMFFLVTNFGAWLGASGDGKPYAASFAGLMTCYTAGLPFYQWTAISDLLFSAVFFGAHARLTRTAHAAEGASAFR